MGARLRLHFPGGEVSSQPVDREPLLEAERFRLTEAARHQRILSEVSRVLLDYVGPDEIEPLRRIVGKFTEAAGEWCAFSLVQKDGTLKSVAQHHPDERQRELAKQVEQVMPPQRWDAEPREINALLQRKPVLIENISDEMLRAGLPSEEAYQLYREIGLTSVIIAPMYDGNDPMGTLVLATTSTRERRYGVDDLDFAFSLAGRAALAVRNARLVAEIAQERDRQRTARLESDRRLAELRAVFDADPNGIGLFDASGALRLASRQMEEIFGIPLRAMYGQHFEQIYRRKVEQAVAQHRKAMLDRIEEIFADRATPSLDEVELEKPRHRWLMRATAPVEGPMGEYLGRLVVYSDVTEQRELERQRSDFLTVAAHELRTPLTPLSMYLQNIERRLQRQQAVEPELIGKARRQVDRLGKLVEDLLDVSRLEARRLQLDREHVELNELVDEVVNDFRPQTRNHELVLHRAPEAVTIDGDRSRLEQVLVNLLANALKYSPHGGQVQVRIERAGEEARVSVIDQGIGIPSREQEQLFQRFFRAGNANTRNYGGLGIGLYVSHEIVTQHGGRFEVESELGRGSTFRFILPLARPLAAAAVRARILLVDDDPEILEVTGHILRDWGYAVDEARDGSTALALLRGSRPDLILVDLMMPVMDGWTLIQRLRDEKLALDVPLVVFSADRDVPEKAEKLAAAASLRKPFALEELQDVVERLLHQKPAA